MTKAALAFDIGGTRIKGGVVDEQGTILVEDSIETASEEARDVLVAHIVEFAHTLKKTAGNVEYAGVGFGAPGLVADDTTLVGGSENIPGLSRTKFSDIGDILGLPTKADNDATVAALGEATYGAGRGYKAVLLATLGTGLGGGIIIHGKAYRGATGYAGELGHMPVIPGGIPCNCGSYGCLEQYASASAVVNRAFQKIQHNYTTTLTRDIVMKDKAKAVFDHAREGDAAAIEILEDTAYYLGIGLASAANLLNLDRILIGGGMSLGADILAPMVDRALKQYTLKLEYQTLSVAPATLGNKAGILGCAAMFFGK